MNNFNNTAFLFPGQGSQAVGMGAALAADNSTARLIFEEVDAALGFPLSRLCFEGPEPELNDTFNTQPALAVVSSAVYSVFCQRFPGVKPKFVAGHSMGEISALVAAGSLTSLEAVRLARRRGELMKESGQKSAGGMAAILGLDIPTLEGICSEASRPGEVVQVANDNCPGQVVISGADAALSRALELAQKAGARRAVRLAVSIAAHSPLMKTAQDEFNRVVERSPIQPPAIPIIGNVSAKPLISVTEIQVDLKSQLTSRVRWTESIQTMIAQGVDTFIEMGSGSVLTGLVKRINSEVKLFNLSSPEDFQKLDAV